MAQQTINLGTVANDGTGDTLRDGGDKANDNFTELYTLKAPLASPTLTGTPAAPTAAGGTNTTQLATTAFVQAAVTALINAAPGALDTLDELAAALGDDANFAATVTTALAGKAPNYWELLISVSDETTALTAGTAKVTFRMPRAVTLTGARASVTTAPTGSTLIVDINEAGSTILSTKLSIDASEKTSTTAASAAVISDSALADDAEMTIDIDQIGSTIAGAGLKVLLKGTL